MAYEEYDYNNEPSTGSLKESLREILNGFQNRTKLREAGTSLKEALQLTPNVTESLGRGGVAQAIGTSGDLRDLSNMINGYLPKGVRNFTRAAEFLANPYATAIQQTAPTTEQTLDFVPRVSAPYEGYKQHETLGEFVAPSLGYFGGKAAKAYGNYVGPTAYKAVEDYMTKTGGILNAVEPSEAKKIQEIASAIDELGFHSPLENAILKIGQPKGTGDQFLKQLEKMPGVKTEELEVTGVKRFLEDSPTVTKQELQNYIQHNRVKLENKVLGAATEDTYGDYRLQGGDVYHDDDYIRGLADDLHYDMKNDDVIRSQEREALLESDPERYADHETNPYSQARLEEDIDGSLYEQAKSQAHDMYYENPITHHYDDYGYDIYGNDDMGYSIKDPNGRFLDIGGRNGIYSIENAEDALRTHLLDEGVIDIDGGGAKHEDYTLPGRYENYREILTTHDPKPMPPIIKDLKNGYWIAQEDPKLENGSFGKTRQEAIDNYRANRSLNYESGHYAETPNVLAHMRVNDRIIDGKKTLFVEEIQSDWHQAGRKKGYQGNGLTTAEKAEYDALQKEADALMQRKDLIIKNLPPEKMNRMRELSDKKAMEKNGVPDAPFKKNWHEMMVKQALDMAVKEGYDAVAFTTGRQQVERYENSLRKAVDEINFNKRDDNTISINAMKNGRETFAGIVQDGKFIDGPGKGKTVEEVLGKGIAKQVSEGELLKPGTIRGKDLTIGGEGMKGFYDKIIPDFINKYGKKYGMAIKKAHLDQNMSGDEFIDHLHSEGLTVKEFDALPQEKRIEIVKRGGEPVHFVDLTDAAKKDIKEKGQPLFSGLGLAPAPLLMGDEEDN